MWEVHERIEGHCQPDAKLVLNFDERQKCRLKARTDDGIDIGIFLPRGEQLRDGDLLKTTDGMIVVVSAKEEALTEVICDDPWTLARAAYHLGNRHVPLQILKKAVRYQCDYVLDDMVVQLGLTVRHIFAGFEPERGAYSHSHHSSGEKPGRTHELAPLSRAPFV